MRISFLLPLALIGCDPTPPPLLYFGAEEHPVRPDSAPKEVPRDAATAGSGGTMNVLPEADVGGAFVSGGSPGDAAVAPPIVTDSGSGGAPSPATDAVPPCTPVRHSNGLGQEWEDCSPSGAWDEAEATKACLTSIFSSFAGCFPHAGSCQGVGFVEADAANLGYLWIYEAPANARVHAGDVWVLTIGAGLCPDWGTLMATWK